MALPAVSLFNATNNILYVYTNGAAPTQAVTVPATSATLLWVPQSPTTAPSFTNTPQAGTLGWGSNTVTLQVAGGTQTQPFTITIPQNTPFPLFSIQLYFFYTNVNNVSWMLLGDGTPLAGSINLGSTES